MRILAFTRYDRQAASTRQRFMQFSPALAEAGFDLHCSPLFDGDSMESIDTGRTATPLRLPRPYFNRLRAIFGGPRPDLLWVQYELFPYLPGLFERIASAAAVPVVIDFDDAYFHRYDRHPNRLVRALLAHKMRPLIRGAAEIVAGNAYLADYAKRWNDRVTIVPTVVDTSRYRPAPAAGRSQVTVGWIGSPTTWRAYVRPQLPLLRRVCEESGARFLAVGAGDSAGADLFPGMELRQWEEAREIPDIHDMDIGIMPLPDDPWARGKCGYKLIQYMACSLPTVASSAGVNSEIVLAGKSGFLADSDEEWRRALLRLIGDDQLRRQMGSEGRDRVVAHYSLAAQAPRLVEVMRRAARQV